MRHDRRTPNPPRVPFVRRCWLELPDGRVVTAFTVNMSAVGAYLTRDDFAPADPAGTPPADELPRVGDKVVCRFTLPDRDGEVTAHGSVSWLNSRQQHPVHSLPPGFGVRFETVSPADRKRIEEVVREYARRKR
jgi:hypothetical protein